MHIWVSEVIKNKKQKIMKIEDLKVGQILKKGEAEAEVYKVNENSFEVQYISGACFTYRQADLDNETLTSYIG